METWLGFVIGVIVILAVGLFSARRALRPGVDATQLTFDAGVMEEVRALTVSGQKIQAIKLLREQSPGLSLVTAKAMVDRIEAAANRPRAKGVPGDNVPSASPKPLDVELEVRGLKAQGEQIAAIKLIREHTGLGLQDAKDYVDSL